MTVTAIYSAAGFTWDIATETSFNSGTKGTDLGILGVGANFTSWELDNEWTAVYQIGQRAPQAYYTAGLKTAVGIDFYACADGWNFWTLALPAIGTGTYSVSTVMGSTVQPSSAMLMVGTPQQNTFQVQGIVFQTLKLNVDQTAPVKVSLTGVGSAFSSTYGSGTVAVGTYPSQMLTWKDVTVSTGTTTVASVAASFVKTLDMTITTNAQQFYALGSPNYQAWVPKASKIECTLTMFHQDPNIEYLFNYLSASTNVGGTITVNFGTTHAVQFQGCYLKKGGITGLKGVEEVMDAVSFEAVNVVIT